MKVSYNDLVKEKKGKIELKCYKVNEELFEIILNFNGAVTRRGGKFSPSCAIFRLTTLLGVPVEINIENSIAAMAACCLTGDLTPDDMYYAVRTFMVPKRRFEIAYKDENHAELKRYEYWNW